MLENLCKTFAAALRLLFEQWIVFNHMATFASRHGRDFAVCS
jgi:hypothetical protein